MIFPFLSPQFAVAVSRYTAHKNEHKAAHHKLVQLREEWHSSPLQGKKFNIIAFCLLSVEMLFMWKHSCLYQAFAFNTSTISTSHPHPPPHHSEILLSRTSLVEIKSAFELPWSLLLSALVLSCSSSPLYLWSRKCSIGDLRSDGR